MEERKMYEEHISHLVEKAYKSYAPKKASFDEFMYGRSSGKYRGSKKKRKVVKKGK